MSSTLGNGNGRHGHKETRNLWTKEGTPLLWKHELRGG